MEVGTSSYAGIGALAAGEWVQITTDVPDIQLVELVDCLVVDILLVQLIQ